jgi:hypothetical protein
MAEQLIDKYIIVHRAVKLAHHRSWQSFSIMVINDNVVTKSLYLLKTLTSLRENSLLPIG